MKVVLIILIFATLLLVVIIVAGFPSIFFRPDKPMIDDNFDYVESGRFKEEVILENLRVPWAIDFLPSGRMIFTERGGDISVYNFETGEKKIVGVIDVSQRSESGLHGIAVDPDFNMSGYVYVYYTANDGNRVSKFSLNDVLEDEEILLDGIPSAKFHDGGRIKFGPDGMLYVTTGDATEPSSAQDFDSTAGKILRMKKDGGIPEDNPFGNYVWSYGHRNSQGISWDDEGNLFSSEHGPNMNDEINIIRSGVNYGWPEKCGDQLGIGDVKPIRCYTEFTLAPSGIAWNRGALYVAGLRGEQLRKLVINNKNVVSEDEIISDLGRIREVVSHGGYLYIATNNKDGRGNPRKGDDMIIRLKVI